MYLIVVSSATGHTYDLSCFFNRKLKFCTLQFKELPSCKLLRCEAFLKQTLVVGTRSLRRWTTKCLIKFCLGSNLQEKRRTVQIKKLKGDELIPLSKEGNGPVEGPNLWHALWVMKFDPHPHLMYHEVDALSDSDLLQEWVRRLTAQQKMPIISAVPVDLNYNNFGF